MDAQGDLHMQNGGVRLPPEHTNRLDQYLHSMFLYIWIVLCLCQVHVKWDMYMYVKDALDMPWIHIYMLIILFFFVWRSTYFDFKIKRFCFLSFFVLNSSSV